MWLCGYFGVSLAVIVLVLVFCYYPASNTFSISLVAELLLTLRLRLFFSSEYFVMTASCWSVSSSLISIELV